MTKQTEKPINFYSAFFLSFFIFREHCMHCYVETNDEFEHSSLLFYYFTPLKQRIRNPN